MKPPLAGCDDPKEGDEPEDCPRDDVNPPLEGCELNPPPPPPGGEDPKEGDEPDDDPKEGEEDPAD